MNNTKNITLNVQDVELNEEEAKAAMIKHRKISSDNEEYRFDNIDRSIRIDWPDEWEEIKNKYTNNQFNIHLWNKEYIDEDDWECEEEEQGYNAIVGIIGDRIPGRPYALNIYHNTLGVSRVRYDLPGINKYRPLLGPSFNRRHTIINNTTYVCATEVDFDNEFIKIIPILD